MRINQHEVLCESRDLITIRTHGDVMEHEVPLFCRWLAASCEGNDEVLYLVDVTHLGDLPSCARHRLAEGLKPLPNSGVAVIGASFVVRLLLQSMIRAIDLFKGRPAPLAFFSVEALARTWLAERRQALARDPHGAHKTPEPGP
ncbi:STAS/SEC14 domain-containing protein [Chondromyces apiculatus]|uniref:STAS/SEC14 domain-containing protein n=1 Tax=Chondromyces apiculatus DSM 436 TaxID=1192034 RepID=A0A017TF81_9BACT|nr:STAS/SEC14 domain-containing protein [Chondromyces apiculatus]EYF07537.1 Hypothetical protein CAP_8660 [Chondromyces apiculatus DSM 436]